VLDHARLDAELMKEGIDHTTFWNVWRLTPEVYRYSNTDQWFVKHDLDKLEIEDAEDRAAYVLSSVVSLFLARQTNRRMMKNRPFSTHDVKLKKNDVTVYTKADKNGPKAGIIPDDIELVMVSYATIGLNDDDIYWSITCFRRKAGDLPLFLLSGFVLQEDLELAE